jgi:hypothetical protein
MKQLANWSPDFLKTLYLHEVDKLANGNLSLKQKEVQGKKIEALYRLGTYDDMKDVWANLLARDADSIKYPVDKEMALVGGILEQIWSNPFGEKQDTPSVRNDKIEEVSETIKELQRLIKKLGEASYEDGVILENILHKRNVEYRVGKGEKIDLPPSPNYLKFININANSDINQLPLDEHMPWKDRSQAQRLGWWAREALGLKLTNILNYYSENLAHYSEVYKDHYAKDTSKLCRGLSWLMNQLYAKDLDDYVARILNVIWDIDSWDKDKVRKIRSYEKTES